MDEWLINDEDDDYDDGDFDWKDVGRGRDGSYFVVAQCEELKHGWGNSVAYGYTSPHARHLWGTTAVEIIEFDSAKDMRDFRDALERIVREIDVALAL